MSHKDGYVNLLDLALIVNKERDTQIGNWSDKRHHPPEKLTSALGRK